MNCLNMENYKTHEKRRNNGIPVPGVLEPERRWKTADTLQNVAAARRDDRKGR